MTKACQRRDIWIALCIIASLSFTAAAEEPSQPTARSQVAESAPAVDVTRLLEIEANVLPPTLRPGPHRHTNLPDYYFEANAALANRLAAAREAYEAGGARSFRAMTLIAGDAGVGKTFLKSQAFDEEYPRADIAKFDIRDLFSIWESLEQAAKKPDLQGSEFVLSELLSIKDHSKVSLVDYLTNQDAKIYVIDSLDEVHADDYAWVLNEVEEFVFEQPHDFVHVVVLGRPLAFQQYWTNREPHANKDNNPQLFSLQPPRFETIGDFQVSSWNYYTFAHDLHWAPEGTAQSMPLEEFIRWADAGFPRSGRFESIAMHPEVPNIAADYALLLDWVLTKPLIGSMLYNLAGNSMIRKIVAENVSEGITEFDELSVMKRYLVAWMKRDTNRADRPSYSKPELLELYLRALEGTAVASLREGWLDDRGYFKVSHSDSITLKHAGQVVSFPVIDVLHHSGMKHLNPRLPAPLSLRFEPIWFHRLLVELHNERTAGGRPRLITATDVPPSPEPSVPR